MTTGPQLPSNKERIKPQNKTFGDMKNMCTPSIGNVHNCIAWTHKEIASPIGLHCLSVVVTNVQFPLLVMYMYMCILNVNEQFTLYTTIHTIQYVHVYYVQPFIL